MCSEMVVVPFTKVCTKVCEVFLKPVKIHETQDFIILWSSKSLYKICIYSMYMNVNTNMCI